jgi:polar amino acid transport system substrate-binding protein
VTWRRGPRGRALWVRVALGGVVALGLTACGQASSNGGSDEPALPSAAATPIPLDPCSQQQLTTLDPGLLTVATRSPATPPFFEDDDPGNGEGFESAVAYAIADQLGFSKVEVTWTNLSADVNAAGDKAFDFAIDQIPLDPELQADVSTTAPYYAMNQALITIEGGPLRSTRSVRELKSAALGAVGDSAAAFVTDGIAPRTGVTQYASIRQAVRALRSGVVEGIVIDLPQVPEVLAAGDGLSMVGEFLPHDVPQEFTLVLAQGNPLTACLNAALEDLAASGELDRLRQTWLAAGNTRLITK